jgi:hypothetical protein
MDGVFRNGNSLGDPCKPQLKFRSELSLRLLLAVPLLARGRVLHGKARPVIANRQERFPLRATAGWRSLSLWRSESLFDVLRKCIDHSAFVATFVCPEEPAANERVDLAEM